MDISVFTWNSTYSSHPPDSVFQYLNRHARPGVFSFLALFFLLNHIEIPFTRFYLSLEIGSGRSHLDNNMPGSDDSKWYNQHIIRGFDLRTGYACSLEFSNLIDLLK